MAEFSGLGRTLAYHFNMFSTKIAYFLSGLMPLPEDYQEADGTAARAGSSAGQWVKRAWRV